MVFDFGRVADRFRALTAHTAGSRVRLLHTVKASSRPEVLRAAGAAGLGFDVTNLNEYATLREAVSDPGFVSVTPTSLRPEDIATVGRMLRDGEVQRVHLDSPAQVDLFCRHTPGGPLGLRLNIPSQDWGEDVNAYRYSRFGVRDVDLAHAAETAARYGNEVRWLHVHNASEHNDALSFSRALELILERAARLAGSVEAVNLGGGLPRDLDAPSVARMARELAYLLPEQAELVLEPGRWWGEGAGFLVAQVLDVKPAEKCVFVVIDASSEVRRWSVPTVPSWGPDPHAGDLPYVIAGSSAFEQDFFGQVRPSPGNPTPESGDWVVLGNISSYSLELATGFNGVRTPVHMVGGKSR